MNHESKYIPVNLVHMANDRLHINLNLPEWVDESKLNIHLPNTLFLMSLGGIHSLSIDGKSDMETTNTMLQIVGVNSDGSASGSGALSKDVSVYEVESHTNKSFRFLPLQNNVWSDMNVILNINEMSHKIRDNNQSLRDLHSWKDLLDESIRMSIITGGTRHLVKDLEITEKTWAAIYNIDMLLLDSMGIQIFDILTHTSSFHVPTIESFTSELAIHTFLFSVLGMISSGVEKNGAGWRLSLIPGWEVDRALILQLLGRILPLIDTDL